MNRIYYILSAVLLLAACAKETPDVPGKPLPPAGMAEVALGEIRLSDADAAFGSEASSSTRATTGNLPTGSTLRLYAFKKGVKDFGNKLSTRTYTVNASGTAVLDAGQEPLYLPTGEADVYLAGPVARNIATADFPIWEDVAGETGIYPFQDVDLIAGYAAATINAGTVNALPDMTLVHKMAKVQVVVSRHEKAVYENLVVKEIKLYGQSETGTYTLDATGGAIAPGAKTDFSYSKIAQETLNEKYSGTALLIPQPSSNLKIETAFECNQIGVDGATHPTLRYRQSGLISTALTAGTATRFTAAPLTPVEIKWRVALLPWDTVNQGTIVVPGLRKRPPVSDALAVCLDGYDAPRTINGKLVWEDNGTAQNHAELMNSLVTWSTDGSYQFNNGGYMQLIKKLTESGVLVNSSSLITIELVFIPDNGSVTPNEGLLRICDDLNAYPGDQIWKGSFYGDGYQMQSEYGSNSRYRTTISTNAPAGVAHSLVWANQHGSGSNNAFLDGVKYSSNGGRSAGIAWCVIGYAFTPSGNNTMNKNFFSGRIKAVRIHSRILTDAEILRNYQFDKEYYGF